MTAKHRLFMFLPDRTLPDQGLVPVAVDDGMTLGVLSSSVHVLWALAAGGTLEDRPRYNQVNCFDKFPFPITMQEQSDRIRSLGEQLDTHRKCQQAAHPGLTLTLTGMYNVLEKLRSGEALTAKERTIHEQGLVSVLRQLHDELDAAVLDAYGWADLLPLLRVAHGNDAPGEGQTREDARRAFSEAVLERLVALNAERAAEEARGLVRWLRPEFQNPSGTRVGGERVPEQDELPTDTGEPAATPTAATKPTPWPKEAVEQVRVVADVLAHQSHPMTLDEIAARFTARGPWKKRLPQLLDMLVALGRAQVQDGRYVRGA